MELKDLTNHSATIEKAFGMTTTQVATMLELLSKKKVLKPIQRFKASAANIASQTR
jgi:hypothetical protein